MAGLIDAETTAKRARAAWHYSGLDQVTLAKKSGIELHTLRRILSEKRPRAADYEERMAIADACEGVPRWFMEHGFAPPPDVVEEDVRAAMAEQAAVQADQAKRIDQLERAIRADDDAREAIGRAKSTARTSGTRSKKRSPAA